jgi:hypothetical protein
MPVRSTLRVAILGSGRLAGGLARKLSAANHVVSIGSGSLQRAHDVAVASGARGGGGTYAEVAASAEVVILACLWHQVGEVMSRVKMPANAMLIDATNPEPREGHGLVLGFSTSGAEEIADLTTIQVVKAFNSVYAEVIEGRSTFPVRPAGFYCGGDDRAREVASRLIADCDLEPIYCGDLTMARYLEPLAALMVALVRGRGLPASGTAIALATSDRPSTAL